MRPTFLLLATTALLLVLSAGPVQACSDLPSKTFREHIQAASSILIVRLESAQLQENGLVRGQFRIVEALKQPKKIVSSYKFIEHSTRWCGGVRLDVGHYFLVVTDAYGATIRLGPSDQSILDLTGYYDESRPAQSAQTDLLLPIHDFLSGKALPRNYPPAHVTNYTSPITPPPDPPRP